MHFGIRAQLLFSLVPVVLGLAATTAWTAFSAAAAARAQILADLDHVAETTRRATFPHNRQTLELMKLLSGADLLLCNSIGQPLTDGTEQMKTLTSLPKSLPEDIDASEPTKVQVDGRDYLCRGVRLQHERLFVFLPTSVLDDAMARSVRPALAIGGFGGLLSLLLALWVTQRVTRRIQIVQRRTRLIAAGDFSPMPLPSRRDELRDLGQSINDMAQQLSRFQETLKATERLRLLSQVSGGLVHQLRNGIAGAKLALQLFVREHQPAPESVQVALRQLTLMEHYLKKFFDLGKALETRHDPVDLSALVEETAALLGPQCSHANIDLRISTAEASGSAVPGHALTTGDPDQLRQVLFNLVSNAIEAAGPNGRVDVRFHGADDKIRLDIADSGAGIPDDVAARLFEPFVTGKPEGVGLGLAVARQIVVAHGGQLDWSRSANETCFRLELPARRPAS